MTKMEAIEKDVTALKALIPVEVDRLALFSEGNVSVVKAAELAGLSKSEMYNLLNAGEIAHVQIGKRRLIPRKALLAFLASKLVTK